MVAPAPPSAPTRLARSNYLSWFAHMGAVYLFHDLYGYLLEMSPDVAEFIDAFGSGEDTAQVVERFHGRFEDADPRQFVDVLAAHAILIEPEDDERDMIWPFVPFKGKWNVWERRDDRLVLWTAWGERPITQIMLDAEETAMWDAFDGEKRLGELRMKFPADKLHALVRRLTHSDVQALKLTMMPWSTYAKRPAMAPKYLTSTMPYPAWQLGTPVPQPRDLSAYHEHDIVDADAQFEHQETTLSHLFREPHPALGNRRYGEALVDALVAKQAIAEGTIRVLEIGAGLGYVARAVIDRLRALGRTVAYTIVELSPVLATAQKARLHGDATWLLGNALELELPGSFDLILANEMVGDLPALQLSRADLGMSLDGTGEVDLDKLRSYGTGATIAADRHVNLADAPEPFYLQTGAFELVERIAGWLAPGGSGVVTEFGDQNQWPRLSTHLDHPELSTHFGQLCQLARGAGLLASVEFVIDVVELDRTQRGLATTRSHFRALHALFESAGIKLVKLGYTPAMLEALVGDRLALANVGELRWDKIEDRLMGLVPHEFRALMLKRP
ncbi:MAG: class I SAM-dependent methyltransferase [Proteobacteria bacterium]|nr:class I SAM-dependent methyltransferase [Pseudomonadota bacterium]